MTALAYKPEPSARAWHELSQRAQPTNVAEMEAAKQLHSRKGGEYLDALNEVRRQQYDPDPPTPDEVAAAFRFKYF